MILSLAHLVKREHYENNQVSCLFVLETEVPYAVEANLEPKIILSKSLSARIINVNYYAQFKNT